MRDGPNRREELCGQDLSQAQDEEHDGAAHANQHRLNPVHPALVLARETSAKTSMRRQLFLHLEQRGVHFRGGVEALSGILVARFQDYFIQAHEIVAVGARV